MKKSILGVIGVAIIATIFCVGCGSEEGELLVVTSKEQQQQQQQQQVTYYTLIVNVDPPEAGTVSRNPDLTESKYVSGDTVSVTVTPKRGYIFSGWTGAVTDTASTVKLKMRSDTTLTAHFDTIPYYTLTTRVNVAGGGTVYRYPVKDSLEYGEQVTVTAVAADYYTFTRWAGASEETSNEVTVTISGNDTLTAIFTPHIKAPGQETLKERLYWLKVNARSYDTYILEVNKDEELDPHSFDYGGALNVTVNLRGVGGNKTINLPKLVTIIDTIGMDTIGREIVKNADSAEIYIRYLVLPKIDIRTDTCKSPIFTIGPNVNLVLDDITLKGHEINNNALVAVKSGGILKMNSGSIITGNFNNTDIGTTHLGGGVYVDSSGTLEMNGGTVYYNKTTSGGGGVFVHAMGTFKMNNGTISHNTANNGGGVYAYGSFTMNGGTITLNTASEYGGGVYAGGTFNKIGGVITGGSDGNTAKVVSPRKGGNAVYINETRLRQATADAEVNLFSGSAENWDK
jgi:uncharacterized repeat protein (TIGR02543 family)